MAASGKFTIISVGNLIVDNAGTSGAVELTSASRIAFEAVAGDSPVVVAGEDPASTAHPGDKIFVRLNISESSTGITPEQLRANFDLVQLEGSEYVDLLGFGRERYNGTSLRDFVAFQVKSTVSVPQAVTVRFKLTPKGAGAVGTNGADSVTAHFSLTITGSNAHDGTPYNLISVGRDSNISASASGMRVEPTRFGYYYKSGASADAARSGTFTVGKPAWFLLGFDAGRDGYFVPKTLADLGGSLSVVEYNVEQGDPSYIKGFSLRQAKYTSRATEQSIFLVMETGTVDYVPPQDYIIRVRLAVRNGNYIGGVGGDPNGVEYVDVYIHLSTDGFIRNMPYSADSLVLVPISYEVDVRRVIDVSSVGYRSLSTLTDDIVTGPPPRIARYDPYHTKDTGFVLRENPSEVYTPGETLYLRMAFKTGASARCLGEMTRFKLNLIEGEEYIESVSFEHLPYNNMTSNRQTHRIFIAIKTKANVALGSNLIANIGLTCSGIDKLGGIGDRLVNIPLALKATATAHDEALAESLQGPYIRVTSIGGKSLTSLEGDVIDEPAVDVARFDAESGNVRFETPLKAAVPGETLYLRIATKVGYSPATPEEMGGFTINVVEGSEAVEQASFVRMPYDDNSGTVSTKTFIAVKLKDGLELGSNVKLTVELTSSGYDELGDETDRTLTMPLSFGMAADALEKALIAAKNGRITSISSISGRFMDRLQGDVLSNTRLSFYDSKKGYIFSEWKQLAYTPGKPIYIRLNFTSGMKPEGLEALARKYSLKVDDPNGVIKRAYFSTMPYYNGTKISEFYFITLTTSKTMPTTQKVGFTVTITSRKENTIGEGQHKAIEMPILIQARGWEGALAVTATASSGDIDAEVDTSTSVDETAATGDESSTTGSDTGGDAGGDAGSDASSD
ncbi:MAG: hypothetical protein LBN26_07705 [Christensenellaceae bacterium]|nr:hypothetical protein [Christensenellaceae bacterium]